MKKLIALALLLGLALVLYPLTRDKLREAEFLSRANIFRSSSPVHEASERYLKSIYSLPEYRKEIAGMADGSALFVHNNHLIWKGLLRLSDRDLEQYLSIRRRAWDRISTHACATYTRAHVKPEEMLEFAVASAETLDRQDIEDLFSLYEIASTAELRHTPDARSLSEMETDEAGRGIYDLLRENERARFNAVLNNLQSASDDEACWLGRTINALPFQASGRLRVLLLRSAIQ